MNEVTGKSRTWITYQRFSGENFPSVNASAPSLWQEGQQRKAYTWLRGLTSTQRCTGRMPGIFQKKGRDADDSNRRRRRPQPPTEALGWLPGPWLCCPAGYTWDRGADTLASSVERKDLALPTPFGVGRSGPCCLLLTVVGGKLRLRDAG